MKNILISILVKKPIEENGIMDHPTKLKKKVNIGAKTKLKVFALVGMTVSFAFVIFILALLFCTNGIY
jgi:hypothetical protein